MGERLYRAGEVAAMYGVKEETIRWWMAQRLIGFVRLGKRAVRIPESEVKRMIDQGRVPARERR